MTEDAAREHMVREVMATGEITDSRVADAMRRVPRHLFVPPGARDQAYQNRPQPIGRAQAISQPLMVALMTQLAGVSPGSRVLEVGTGSGYQSAVLAELGAWVISVERHADLAGSASRLLASLGYGRVRVVVGDGSLGWPEEAPFDAILVTAASPEVPPALVRQLACPGRLVAPVGGPDVQALLRVRRDASGAQHMDEHGECVFVPLIGAAGWPPCPSEAPGRPR